MRAPLYEASTRIHAIHPSGLPLTCSRRDGSAALGLPSKLHTPPTKSRRVTPRWRQAIEHGPGTTRSTSHPLILQSVVLSFRATSRRTVHLDTLPRDDRRACVRGNPIARLPAAGRLLGAKALAQSAATRRAKQSCGDTHLPPRTSPTLLLDHDLKVVAVLSSQARSGLLLTSAPSARSISMGSFCASVRATFGTTARPSLLTTL
jgi:hypothetical protein